MYIYEVNYSDLDINAVMDRLHYFFTLVPPFRPENTPCLKHISGHATVVNKKRTAECEYNVWMKNDLQYNNLNGIWSRNVCRDKSSLLSSRQTVNKVNSSSASGPVQCVYIHGIVDALNRN